MIPLFEHHPLLKERLPYVSLGNYPTPIRKLNKAGAKIGLFYLYMKEDGLTGELYGGNKIRKLEFVLGDALRQGAHEVLTFGFAGSNHALATAICAKQLGLKSISMLMPQHNAHYVRRNLLMSKHVGVEFHQNMNKCLLLAGARHQILRHERKTGKAPYVIPPGGSSPLGTTGFINAAFELGNQIVQKELPEPDRIYVPLGTGGTAVGLMIGLRALNLKSAVIPVRVADHALTPEKAVRKLYSKTVSFLRSCDPSFPDLELSTDALEVVDEYLGDGYAQFTKAAAKAIALVKETEGTTLDGTYTGKAFAALLADARKQNMKDKVVLLWNTLNSRDFSHSIRDIDYHQLPKRFHKYFEEEVQPLDE